jgi:hypothetical protein
MKVSETNTFYHWGNQSTHLKRRGAQLLIKISKTQSRKKPDN